MKVFSQYQIKSSSIENEPILCVIQIEYLLLIHLIIARMTEFFVFHTCFILPLLALILFAPSWNNAITALEDHGWAYLFVQEERYSCFDIFIRELKLTLIYSCAGLLYTSLGLAYSNFTVRYTTFLRWFIEASNIPFPFVLTFLFSHSGFIESFLNYYQVLYLCRIVFKVPLFFAMRALEKEQRCILIDLQTFLLNKFCKTF